MAWRTGYNPAPDHTIKPPLGGLTLNSVASLGAPTDSAKYVTDRLRYSIFFLFFLYFYPIFYPFSTVTLRPQRLFLAPFSVLFPYLRDPSRASWLTLASVSP